MTRGTIRLNRQKITKDRLWGYMNPHIFSQEARLSYPTVRKYLVEQDPLEMFSGRILFAILHDGYRLSIEEINNLRLSDVFEIVPHE